MAMTDRNQPAALSDKAAKNLASRLKELRQQAFGVILDLDQQKPAVRALLEKAAQEMGNAALKLERQQEVISADRRKLDAARRKIDELIESNLGIDELQTGKRLAAQWIATAMNNAAATEEQATTRRSAR